VETNSALSFGCNPHNITILNFISLYVWIVYGALLYLHEAEIFIVSSTMYLRWMSNGLVYTLDFCFEDGLP
jgi:hypothetical protein